MHSNKGQSYSLADGLSGGILDGVGLNGNDGRPSSNSGGFIRDIRKASEKILRLCDFLVKVFDIVLYLFNHVFLYLQIFWYFDNYLENLPQLFFPHL